jgi:L-threonylcarbamoyladenylate synthase
MLQVIRLTQENRKKILDLITKIIKKGKVVVLPTDTVYGLVTDATNRKAVNRLFKIKKRERRKPLPIFVSDLKMVSRLAYLNEKEKKFLKKIWPGKITVILKKKKGIKIFGIASKTIGLRIPDFDLIKILISRLRKPLTGTSANISGKPSSFKIKDVIKQFKGKKFFPDLILDAGNLRPSQSSTVVDLTGKKPKILRRGEELKKLIKELERTNDKKN